MNLITITQIILGCGVMLLLIAVAVAGVLNWISCIFNRHFERGKQYQFNRERDRLREHSWWFSEDKPTRELLNDLADDGRDINDIRERWRNARKEPQL